MDSIRLTDEQLEQINLGETIMVRIMDSPVIVWLSNPKAGVLRRIKAIVGAGNVEFFLNNPNSYLNDGRPVDLIGSDPDRVITLALAFARPAEAF